jgi:hypothetical protein
VSNSNKISAPPMTGRRVRSIFGLQGADIAGIVDLNSVYTGEGHHDTRPRICHHCSWVPKRLGLLVDGEDGFLYCMNTMACERRVKKGY